MKVKIKRTEIVDKCNWKHPDFGTFASFLDGLCKDGYLHLEAELLDNN